jgi:hypothetical protein
VAEEKEKPVEEKADVVKLKKDEVEQLSKLSAQTTAYEQRKLQLASVIARAHSLAYRLLTQYREIEAQARKNQREWNARLVKLGGKYKRDFLKVNYEIDYSAATLTKAVDQSSVTPSPDAPKDIESEIMGNDQL